MRVAIPGFSVVLVVSAAVLLVYCCMGSGDAAASQGDIWGSVSQGFQVQLAGPVTASTPQTPGAAAPLGSPVMLHFTLQNVTAETLLIADSYPEHDYSLTVVDAYGNVVRRTGDASSVWRNVVLEVQPGGTLTSDYDLTRMYGALADGEYTIAANRDVLRLDGEGTGQVASNPIKVVVSGAQVSLAAGPTSRGVASRGRRLAKGGDAGRQPCVAARPVLARHGFRVAWDAAKGVMTASKGKLVATFAAQQRVMVLGRQKVPMTKPATIVKGQLSVPGQALSMVTSLTAKQVAEAGRSPQL